MTFDWSNLSDLPALKQLGRALWRNGSVRGAAVMVGAGFSKNAECTAPDTPNAPNWRELLNELVKQLYPSNRKSAPRDQLRIAEEYRTYFGQAALDGFIRTRFPDRAWLPGPLHVQLLNFPWSDILTTNWDTILERAAEEVTDIVYEVVRTEADIAHARSPRIIKLHGTLGDNNPLIFATDDYRTYPNQRAAFVNLARQVFIENDLCLIGFSGDDPNFIEWSGWVRDRLGGNARRIYLVGYLDLSAPARRYLEAHNISPIDFGPLVSHLPRNERHSAAIKIFFDALHAEQPAAPHDWKQHAFNEYPRHRDAQDIFDRARTDDAFSAEALRETARLLRDDRENYPGWLVCPRTERHSAHAAAEAWIFLRPAALARIEVAQRAEILYEFLWSYTTRLCDLHIWLRDALVAIMDEANPTIERDLRLKFMVALMRDARLEGNDDNFRKWSSLIDSEANPDDPEQLDANYQRCLRARDRLELAELLKLVAKLESENPLWRLRKAGLFADAGEQEKAIELIETVTTEFEKAYRLDRNSLWTRSCLAWAGWLNRAAGLGNFQRRGDLPRAHDFRNVKIDPDHELEVIEAAADKIHRKAQEDDADVIPLFDPGSYRQGKPKAQAQPDAPGFQLLVELDQLTERTGIPMLINNVQVAAAAAKSIAKITFHHRLAWYTWLLRGMHSQFDSLFDRYFSRIVIAQLPQGLAEQLSLTLDSSIAYWRQRISMSIGEERVKDRSVAVDRLRLSLVAQSHMTVRMTVERALQEFQCGTKIAGDSSLTHRWIVEAAGELTRYAMEAIPKPSLSSLALDVIKFPLAAERGGDSPGWPDLIRVIAEVKPLRESRDHRWDQRVHELLSATEPKSNTRAEAASRLAYLARHDVLKSVEQEALAAALWNKLDSGLPPLPADTRLLVSEFATLPAPIGIDPIASVKVRLFDRDLTSVLDCSGPVDTRVYSEKYNHLISLYNTAPLKLSMPAKRAAELFDQVAAWSPFETSNRDQFASALIEDFNDRIRRLAGDALAFAIVPAMLREDRTDLRLRALLDLITRTSFWRGIAALPDFLESVPSMEEEVLLAINGGLSGTNQLRLSGATAAIIRWSKLASSASVGGIPNKLTERLITMIESRQDDSLPLLLAVATHLVEDGRLTIDDMRRLEQSIQTFRDELNYVGVIPDSRRAVSISLARQQAVNLAKVLKKRIPGNGVLEGWLEEARLDPLPEVRFSVTDFE